MDGKAEPRSDSYDVVVVGGGLGGLSAAAFLSKAGRKTLVIEQQEWAGGYAHAFRRGPYIFDSAIHGISPGKGGALSASDILDMLGVGDQCTFIPFHNPLYAAVFPDFKLNVLLGIEEFIDAHLQHFSHEEEGLHRFMDLCLGLTRAQEASQYQFSLRDLGNVQESVNLLVRYRSATLQDALDECLTDPKLKAVLSASWPNVGLPPSEIAFPIFTGMFIPTVESGRHYCQGTFENLVQALIIAMERYGGELLSRRHVSRILLEDGKAVGVRLDDGSEIRAPVVISNADARETFGELVGFEHLPATFVKRLLRMKPAVSALQVYCVTKLDLAATGGAHESWWYGSWDHDEAFRENLAGRPTQIGVNVPSMLDPSLAPEGEYAATILAMMPYDIGTPWSEAKDGLTEKLLDVAEEIFPGFRDNLVFAEAGTPVSMERYTRNYQGASYGWANSPQQIGSKRLNNRSPVDGLYVAGHWAQPSFGGLGVMYSGMQTAQLLLETPEMDRFVQALTQ